MGSMTTPDRGNGSPSARPDDTGAAARRPDAGEEPVAPTGAAEKKRRNPWIWISALLAIVSVGLLVWALTVNADSDTTQEQLDAAQRELDTTTQELESTKQDVEALQSSEADQGQRRGSGLLTVGAFATAKALYDDLAAQLGATQEDLGAVEQDLQDANDKAKQAEQDAKTAKKRADQADNETDEAKAQADLEFPRFRGHLMAVPTGAAERMSVDAIDPAVFVGVPPGGGPVAQDQRPADPAACSGARVLAAVAA